MNYDGSEHTLSVDLKEDESLFGVIPAGEEACHHGRNLPAFLFKALRFMMQKLHVKIMATHVSVSLNETG